MPAWGLLPATLPAVTITGMWIVYAMALANNHICPVHNWSYNQSCGRDGPAACCTLDHIPLVSKCGTFPPESCFFSLICSLGSFLVMLVGLLRYAHVIERCGPSLLNTLGLAAGWLCAAGLTMVGNFQPASLPEASRVPPAGNVQRPGPLPKDQPRARWVPAHPESSTEPGLAESTVDHAKVLHYIGAGVAFPTSTLFVFLQSVLTYRMARTRGHYWTGHVRSLLTALAFVTLVFSGVFFVQESFVLQHLAALCEWVFIISVLVFYGTFAFEFGAISTGTFLALLKASRAAKSHPAESSVPAGHSHAESLPMV